MSTSISKRANARPRTRKALSLVLVSVLAVALVVALGEIPVSASASKFDDVQVSVQTSQDLPYSYTLTAYNSSGFQVAYYQTNYPEAAFELPDGTYLFTVQASYGQSYYPCIGCVSVTTFVTMQTTSSVVAGPMIPANSTLPTNSTLTTNSTGVLISPIYRMQSANEYGYAVEQVSGPASITIRTFNATSIPNTQVTIHVNYVNGTAAQGAWVYASVVDDSYYNGQNTNSSGETGAGGSVTLTMPSAPLLVTADLNVPIVLPQTQSNVTVTVGGQKVNVTLYWQPSSVYLQGQTLILPPQTSGNIVLQYQPQQVYYPVTRGGSTNSIGSATTVMETTTYTAASVSRNAAQKLPSFSPNAGQAAAQTRTTSSDRSFSGESLLLGVTAATIAVVLAIIFVAVRGKRSPSVVPA